MYRPITPITPSHTPSGSIASSRSRTPGQLSLHEYRKQQRQEPDALPIIASAPVPKTVKRKIAVTSFHGGATGIPTAPPTPMEFDFGFKDDDKEDDDDVTEEELVNRFLSGNGRGRKGKSPRKEGTRLPHRSNLSTPRLRPNKPPSLASTSSISSLPVMSGSNSSRSLSQPMPSHIPKLDPSPPASPSTPLLPLLPDLTPLPTHSHSYSRQEFPPHHHLNPTLGAKKTNFKPIKRLPRPSSQRLPPLVPSPLAISPASAPATTSSYSPFSLRKYSFPEPPLIDPDSNPNPNESSESISELSLKALPTTQADASFTDLLHLYGASFELLNRHASLQSLNIIPSLSEPSSPDLAALPVFAPKHRFPNMNRQIPNPFGNQNSRQDQDEEFLAFPDYRDRGSFYPSEFDSQSIKTTGAPLTPGMKKKITDYSDLLAEEPDHYSQVDSIFDQYGRNSGESARPLAHRSAGQAPGFSLPPVPLGSPPVLNLPSNHSSSPERVTDYGKTQDLLNSSSTPGLEVSRAPKPPLFPFPFLETSPFDPSGDAVKDSMSDRASSVARSEAASEWLTVADSSMNDMTNFESTMGEFYPFANITRPPPLTIPQRRMIDINVTPEVPSPHSTVPESHQSLRATSPIPGNTGDDDSGFYNDSMGISHFTAHDAHGTSTVRIASSIYSQNNSEQAKSSSQAQSPESAARNGKHRRNLGHYTQNISEAVSEEPDNIAPQMSYQDRGLVDPAVLSSEPNDSIETGSNRRLSRLDNLSLPLNQLNDTGGGIRRSLTDPNVPINHRISFFDPQSGKTSVGVAGQNKLMDFGIEMDRLNGRSTSKRSSTAPDALLSSHAGNQDTTHLNADTTLEHSPSTSTRPMRLSPFARFRATFARPRPAPSSQNTSLDTTIPLPTQPFRTTYQRPASSARSSLQPLVPRPAPVAVDIDRHRQRAQAWKPMRIGRPPREQQQLEQQRQVDSRTEQYSPHLLSTDTDITALPPVSPTTAKMHHDTKPSSSSAVRFHHVATYPCHTSTASLDDIEAAAATPHPLHLIQSHPEYLSAHQEHIRQQKRWSRFYLLVCTLLVVPLPLYSLGVLDPLMQLHVPSRPHMCAGHRRWAWNFLWVIVVGILIAIAVWAVLRKGT
jgi:hypothetical protein